MKPLASIIASPSELVVMNAHSNRVAKQVEVKADSINQHLNKRTVDGEIRYYLTPSIFKTVRGNYFKIEGDGTMKNINAAL